MKTLAAAALSVVLAASAMPAFAQSNMGNDTMMNETTNNTTAHHHHHKGNKTHHHHTKNAMMNGSADTTQNLNQNEMNSTAPAGTAQ